MKSRQFFVLTGLDAFLDPNYPIDSSLPETKQKIQPIMCCRNYLLILHTLWEHSGFKTKAKSKSCPCSGLHCYKRQYSTVPETLALFPSQQHNTYCKVLNGRQLHQDFISGTTMASSLARDEYSTRIFFLLEQIIGCCRIILETAYKS